MSLSLASSIAQTSLANTAAKTSIVSRNIDGVNDPNYSRKIVNLTTSSTGGGELVSATRAANRALFDNMLVAQSGAASESALADGLNKLDQAVGDPANGQSISALIGSLSSALQTYSASPNDTTVAQTAVMAASNLSNALNAATTTVQGVRAGRRRHGDVGADHQPAPDAIPGRQLDRRQRARHRRRCQRRAGFARCHPVAIVAAARHHDLDRPEWQRLDLHR